MELAFGVLSQWVCFCCVAYLALCFAGIAHCLCGAGDQAQASYMLVLNSLLCYCAKML